jgi:hypothetical protein
MTTRPWVIAAGCLLLSTGALAQPEPEPQTPPPPAPAGADTDGREKPDGRETLAVLKLEGNAGGLVEAPGVTSLLASRLSESPRVKVITQSDIGTMLGLDRMRQLVKGESCTDECMVELSGAIGARYVLTGRLDRFGAMFVLTSTLFDSRRAVSLAKPRAEAASEGQLPAAAGKVADQILSAFDAEAGIQGEPLGRTGFGLGFKAGSAFFTGLLTLSLAGDVELDYAFMPEWVGLLQVGFSLVRATSSTGSLGQVTLVPSILGVKRRFRLESSFQPYAGLGLGVELALFREGFFSGGGALPSVIALGGFEYLFNRHFGVMLEAKTNVVRALVGLVTDVAGSGLAIDLSVGLVYRF